MRFTFRDLALDTGLLVLGALVWFGTDRQAVREALQTVVNLVLGY